MNSLEIKNLRKNFSGVAAVDNLSLKFFPGQITGIIGPNGSGKSTLVNLLSGLVQIDNGIVIVDDEVKLTRISVTDRLRRIKNMNNFKQIKAEDMAFYGLTRTFQEVRLFNQMTALDNILVVLTERNIFGALIEKHGEYHLEQAKKILEKVDLWKKKDELAVNLSYGQRKLLEIARALSMSNANIFLFDEPFAGLFPQMIKVVKEILEELKKSNKIVVLIEHNMNLIRELSDRVIVLDSGELLAEGAPEKVLAEREVIEAYLGD